MSPVRIGAVGYLNARPLVFDLEQDARFDVRFDLPSRCADLLHAGQTDLGLIPSIEFLRAPGGPDAYRIVPDLAIASRGKVASVAIFTTRDMRDVRSISLDTSSRTSVALTRVVCARVFGIAPAFEAHGPDLPEMLAGVRRRADHRRPGVVPRQRPRAGGRGRRGPDGHGREDRPRRPVAADDRPAVCLCVLGGTAWSRRTQTRSGRCRATREASLGRTREISEFYFPGDAIRQDISDRYLRDNIKYYLGPDERAGLELFYRYAAEARRRSPRGHPVVLREPELRTPRPACDAMTIQQISDKVDDGGRVNAAEALVALSRGADGAAWPAGRCHTGPQAPRTHRHLHHRPQRELHERLRRAVRVLRVLSSRRLARRLCARLRRAVPQD